MEFVKMHPFCLVCLSSDRNLYPIKDLTFFASLTLLQLSEAGAFALCWECNRIMRKAKLFRSKALKAQAVLNGSETANTPLSNIAQGMVSITDIPPQVLNENLNDEIDIKPEFIDSDNGDNDNQPAEDENNVGIKEEYYSSSDDETLSDIKKENMEFDTSQTAQRIKINPIVESAPMPRFVPILPKPGLTTAPQPKTLIVEPLTPSKKDPVYVFKDVYQPVANPNLNYTLKKLTPLELVDFRSKLETLGDQKLFCVKCLIMYETEAEFDSHMNVHSESAGAFPCHICERRFQTEAAVRSHTTTHYRIFECNLCKEECVTHQQFVRHYDSRHHDVGSKCDKCGESFPTKKALGLHKRRQHSRRAPCTICNKMVRTCLMKKHMEIHTVRPPVQCDICHKTYSGEKRLQAHKKMTHALDSEDKDDAAYCVTCDIKFKKIATYKVHLERSSKHVDKSHLQKCPHCDKQFSCANYLRGHINRTHLENNIYNCDQCPKKFSYSSQLRLHTRKMHENHQPPRNKVCDQCGKAFFTIMSLREHINSHNNIRPFVCQYCGDTFSYSGARYTHIRLTHKNNKTKTENNKTKTVNNKTKMENNKTKTKNNKRSGN